MMTHAEFARQMEARMAPDAEVNERSYPLLARRAHAVVRFAGAYVPHVQLVSPDGREHRVLGGRPGNAAKLEASHAMMQKAYGDQHGEARRIDYRKTGGHNGPEGTFLDLQASVPKDAVQIHRRFTLERNTYTVSTSLVNNTEAPVRQRLGEHLYFSVPRLTSEASLAASVAGLRITNGDGSDALADPTVLSDALAGNFRIWKSTGPLDMQFPHDGKHIKLSATATLYAATGESLPVEDTGFMIWARPEEQQKAAIAAQHARPDDYLLCVEPVWGYSERGADVDNEGFTLPVGAVATLETSIEML